MPTPDDTAAAIIAKIESARADALATGAAARDLAAQQLKPITDLPTALGAALDAKANAYGGIRQSFAVLRSDGRFASEYALTRADGDRRILSIAYAPPGDAPESIFVGGLGAETADAFAKAGVPKAGPAHPLSDEVSFAPSEAAWAATILADKIGAYFAAQSW